MRQSVLLHPTLREAPADIDGEGHRLLLRAGLVRQVAAGSYAYLPLGLVARRRIEGVLRDEMERAGLQEVQLPLVQPAELWRRSGRERVMGDDLAGFTDRRGRDLRLAMTHEELIVDLLRPLVRSHRQLPLTIFQIAAKYRDEPRPRGGLLRLREFTMKDAYSLHRDDGAFETFYRRMLAAYARCFERLGLDAFAVESDPGAMGGSRAHEFMVASELGEDTVLLCSACDHRANRQVATFVKPDVANEEPLPLDEVATPETATIEALTDLLGIAPARTAKAVFMTAEVGEGSVLAFALLRGDMELSETKLGNALGAHALRPARDDEIRAVGAIPGYASPIGIARGAAVRVVVDDAVATSPNLVTGANREGWHLRNSNLGRDYEADIVTDIAAARDGDACPRCGGTLRAQRAIEVGNTFDLGTRYPEALGLEVQGDEGGRFHPHMGSYGIGVDRALATIVETHRDDDGIVWPRAVAPADLHLVALDRGSAEVTAAAEGLYRSLREGGVRVVVDDRDERPGVKFHDADLLGLPLRLTLGRRAFERGEIEVRERLGGERSVWPLPEAAERALAWVAAGGVRAFDPESDVATLLGLLRSIERPRGREVDEAGLRGQLAWLGHDPARDRWLLEEGAGAIGHAWTFAQSERRSIVHADVLPDLSGRERLARLFGAAVARARAKDAEQIVSGADADDRERDALLRELGFVPAGDTRSYRLPEGGEVEGSDVPHGFRLASLAELDRPELLVAACNACYADLWGHRENSEPMTLAFLDELRAAHPEAYRPDLTFLVLDPEGAPAGLCSGGADAAGLSVDAPASTPPHRRLELQRPLIAAVVRRLRALGGGPIALHSWGDPPETDQLYRRLGFEIERHFREYLLASG
jgi:prolyl-tRNA synthetase